MAVRAPLRLMVVEDDLDTSALILETLRDYFPDAWMIECTTVAQALQVDPAGIDLVLSDMNLPDGTGLEILTELLAKRPDLPVVVVTGEGILENAIEAIRRGAYDYVVKAGDYLFAIPLIVEKNLAIWRTKAENRSLSTQLEETLEELRIKNQQLEALVHELETMASTDPLTDLANRRAFEEALSHSFAECQRYGHDLACIMIDLDGFKQLNDTFGHQCGDQLLQCAARVLKNHCRLSDVPGRFGGDEFIVLLPQTNLDTAHNVAQRIGKTYRTESSRHFEPRSTILQTTMSMGLATMHASNPANPQQLIAHADRALYQAKEAGKTRIVIYDPHRKTTLEQSSHLHVLRSEESRYSP